MQVSQSQILVMSFQKKLKSLQKTNIFFFAVILVVRDLSEPGRGETPRVSGFKEALK